MSIRSLATAVAIGSMFVSSLASAAQPVRPAAALPKAGSSAVFSSAGVASPVRAGKVSTEENKIAGFPVLLLVGFAGFTALIVALTNKSNG